MGRRRDKPRLIPEQNKRICRAICMCQLTMVLSCVSIVYLSVAIYSPSLKAFKSGFELKPVMCQTIDRQMPSAHCPWASCGEWCLTRTTGFCPQIHAVVRRNGTDIQLNNCNRISNTTCSMINTERLNKFNCNNGTACNNIHGVFNCSNGHCRNMSEYFLCHHKADGPTINSARDNTKLNGFFECHGVLCTKIKRPFSCDRYCSKITTAHINVLLTQEDSVITADCLNGWAFSEARGNELGIRIDPIEFWNETQGNLLTNCASIQRLQNHTILATDCINGTILPDNALPQPFMNFTQFWKINEGSYTPIDPQQKFLPNQRNLTIYDSKKLLINLDGCVNTLRGECKQFVARYGNDGDNNTAQSRYQCYYNQNPNVEFVVARYDLNKVYRELLISLIIPIVLFIISSISLIIITKSVRVGDDAKMRCICTEGNSDNEDFTNSKTIKRNSSANISNTTMNTNQLPKTVKLNTSSCGDQGTIDSMKSLLPISPNSDPHNIDNICGSELNLKTIQTTDDGTNKAFVLI